MSMSPGEAALRYAGKLGWPVFPRPGGRFIKGSNGWKDASRDPDVITAWWRRWPEALIATPTGDKSGIVVLDIDRKNGRDGYDALEQLGKAQLPETPLSHTPNGGNHVFFRANPTVEIRFAPDWRPGLDILGTGTSVALPTPGWGYRWDPHLHPGTTEFKPAPGWFAHQKPKHSEHHGRGLDPQRLLQDACGRIRSAAAGERHKVLNREAFVIGCVVGRGVLNEANARHELEAAAAAILARDFNGRQAEYDLRDAFKAGLRKGGQRR
jgi:Bifunctional DNA primase/polymerase, N-terminal